MTDDGNQEYDDDFVYMLEAVWGEGFLSPGGTEEVDVVIGDVDLTGMTVLDIGCGSGGLTRHLVNSYSPEKVVGIDVEKFLIELCSKRAEDQGLSDKLEYVHVDPGPIPLDSELFDVVVTKDSLIHIEDKDAICAEVFRLLKPGGKFIASDWMCSEGPMSKEMEHYVDLEDLGFGMGNRNQYHRAMERAGFQGIDFTERNQWYLPLAREEHQRMSGELYSELVEKLGKEYADHEINIWEAMVVVLERGELRPTHWKALRP